MNQAAAETSITVVSGLPRSGTSLMMQMLAAGGMSPLSDDVRSADDNNPRGYFEFEQVKRLRTDRGWLEEARGRVVKIIHLLLRELPVDERFQYRVVFMRRDLAEVLASQRTMLEREGKKAADEAVLTKVYQAQIAQTEEWLRAQPRFSVLFVEHRSLFEVPEPICGKLNDFLGGQLNIPAMLKVIEPDLYRQRMV